MQTAKQTKLKWLVLTVLPLAGIVLIATSRGSQKVQPQETKQRLKYVQSLRRIGLAPAAGGEPRSAFDYSTARSYVYPYAARRGAR